MILSEDRIQQNCFSDAVSFCVVALRSLQFLFIIESVSIAYILLPVPLISAIFHSIINFWKHSFLNEQYNLLFLFLRAPTKVVVLLILLRYSSSVIFTRQLVFHSSLHPYLEAFQIFPYSWFPMSLMHTINSPYKTNSRFLSYLNVNFFARQKIYCFSEFCHVHFFILYPVYSSNYAQLYFQYRPI